MGHHRTERPPADYETDFFAWTQRQARLLHVFGRGGADTPGEIDFIHAAEEIGDLGKAQLDTVKSLIRQILVHLAKAVSDPKAPARAHWRTEAITFHADLLDRYTPSMRQHIDLQRLWARALRIADASLQEHDAGLHERMPERCPFPLVELLDDAFEVDDAIARLKESVDSSPAS